MLSKCIDSGYLVGTTLLTLFFDCFETLQMFCAWNEDVHAVLVLYFDHFSHFFCFVNLVSFLT